MHKDALIYVAGHNGLVGNGLWRALHSAGYTNLLGASHAELELRDRHAVDLFFDKHKPKYVFLAAAKVGGIEANRTLPVSFLLENLQIQNNVLHAAHTYGVKKLMFFASSCIYPREADQPMQEDALLTGPLEPTNESYALAKIAGLKLCSAYRKQHNADFITVMPASIYGPNDTYDLEKAHVIPALIRKFCEAQQNNHPKVTCWGTGKPIREFLHVDDLAQACLFLMKQSNLPDKDFINIGTGVGTSIKQLTHTISKLVDFQGSITWDHTKPDGMPKKVLDNTILAELGWKPGIELTRGLKQTIDEYQSQAPTL